jgi:hypothetical protein
VLGHGVEEDFLGVAVQSGVWEGVDFSEVGEVGPYFGVESAEVGV